MSFYKSNREDISTKKADRLYLIEFEIEGEQGIYLIEIKTMDGLLETIKVIKG